MNATTPIARPTLCYLCGKSLSEPTNVDHVPPKQLYVQEIRKKHPLNLLTIEVHTDCNKSFQHDEDYFVNTLAPFAQGSYAGSALLRDVFTKHAEGKKRGLVQKVLNEFDHRPSGIIIPPGQVVKRFEGARVHRVAWKIVRGLYFHETGQVLPEDTPSSTEVFAPDRPPSAGFSLVLADLDGEGDYPGVFDYKHRVISEANNLNYWGMLFWDRVILAVAFHDPACGCDHCVKVRAART